MIEFETISVKLIIIHEFLRKIVYIKNYEYLDLDSSMLREREIDISADSEMILIAYKLLFILQRIIFIACPKLLQVFSLMKIFVDTIVR